MTTQKTPKQKAILGFLFILFSIVSIFFIFITIVFFLKGYSEIIKNQSVSVITFFSVITIFMALKFGDLLLVVLNDLLEFIKNKRKLK